MNKFISTVILTIATVMYSLVAAAGSDLSDKNKEPTRKDSSQNTSKKEGDKSEGKSGSASDKDAELLREKTLSERKNEYKDQEVMDKKPYKQ